MTEQALNDQFYYNSLLAKSLLQFLPEADRQSLRLWINKLLEVDSNIHEMAIRNDYIWFILLMLQSGRVREPFNLIPPDVLHPLKDSVPEKVYEEVLISKDQNTSWTLDEENTEDKEKDECTEQGPVTSSAPKDFYDKQPKPQEGIICYIAAFSDQDQSLSDNL